MDRGVGHEKKTDDLQWLDLWRINSAQKKMTMFEKDDRLPHQKGKFFIGSMV